MRTSACQPCARAKRKCERQRPKCARCRRRNIECTYPPAKQSNFVLCEGNANELAHNPGTISHIPSSEDPFVSESLPSSHNTLSELPDLDELLVEVTNDITSQSSSDWVSLTPAIVTPCFPTIPCYRANDSQLQSYAIIIREWLAEWVEHGSNTFIHASLYRRQMPLCIQDAYTTLSSYMHKTASNERTIFQILENRVKQLVATGGRDSVRTSNNDSFRNGNFHDKHKDGLNSIEHLARVQALVVYQFLALFDGDIRLRHIAEGHMSLLDDWVQEMLDHAAVMSRSEGLVDVDSFRGVVNNREDLNWHCWIVAESTQRTCMIATGVTSIFQMMQTGTAPSCFGIVVFTTRPGVWEAPSAIAWSRLCLESNTGGLMQLSEAERLFTEATPEDVNDFTKLFLEATFGQDRMEKWAADSRKMARA